jgi:hypothetical protein
MSLDSSPPDPQRPASPFATNNPFGENPYASPPAFNTAGGYAANRGRGMVSHVPVVAILMGVQGVLETVAGGGLIAMGVALPTILTQQLAQQGGGPGDDFPPEAMTWIMLGVYGGIGLVMVIVGLLRIVAAIRNYRFRGRILGVVSLIGGLVTAFTCYCAPTSIALAVYGLVTYFNPQVTQAFALGEAGHTKDEVEAAFR